MQIDGNTRVGGLVEEYPFLIDFLANYAKEFQMLKNPIMRKTVARFATLSRAASIAGVTLPDLLAAVVAEIEQQTGTAVEIGASATSPEQDAADRLDILKSIIRDLHDGAPLEEVQRRFNEAFQDVEPAEIAAMEQQLAQEGMPPEEIKRLCDVHVAVFKEALDRQEATSAPPGHPVHTFQKENAALGQVIGEIRATLKAAGDPPDAAEILSRRQALRAALSRLNEVEKHYQRKENQLFPYLEQYGVTAPPKVMWAVHDDIRAMFKKAFTALESEDAGAVADRLNAVLVAVEDMIYKEENILFPMSLQILAEEDWVAMREGESAIGYALVTPDGQWPTSGERSAAGAKHGAGLDAIPLDTGLLTLEQVNLLLTHLPVDLTFVDENDTVRYYSEGKERIFPRSPGVIGREVQNCHPPKSLHLVNRILEAFRNGTRDVAEFWIEMQGRFIHIRYFALRDAQGHYKGCLEVSQDVTAIRNLQGERRLLDWE